MFARYLKMQLMVLLCGGLVGPIFLAVYFGLHEQDLLGWMFWAGLIVTAADVLVALGLTYYGANSAAKTALLEQHGVLALAQITALGETGTRINDQPLVKLNLHISGAGFAPFDSENRVIANVTRMGNFSARKLVVLVDPNTQEYIIDWERSALVNGLVPAKFTLAEDNTTYDLSGQAAPLMQILQILKDNDVPLNRMVDIRSNPVLRGQVQAVVRSAAQQADRGSAAPAGVPEVSAAERLEELETLRAGGVLTDQEYAAKRAQIIADICGRAVAKAARSREMAALRLRGEGTGRGRTRFNPVAGPLLA